MDISPAGAQDPYAHALHGPDGPRPDPGKDGSDAQDSGSRLSRLNPLHWGREQWKTVAILAAGGLFLAELGHVLWEGYDNSHPPIQAPVVQTHTFAPSDRDDLIRFCQNPRVRDMREAMRKETDRIHEEYGIEAPAGNPRDLYAACDTQPAH